MKLLSVCLISVKNKTVERSCRGSVDKTRTLNCEVLGSNPLAAAVVSVGYTLSLSPA